MRRKTMVAAANLVVVAGIAAVLVAASGSSSSNEAVAQGSLGDVLGQLRRNAKVSERLNVGFFRAPQTRAYAGSAFVPTESQLEYASDQGDSALFLRAQRDGRRVVNEGGDQVLNQVEQTTGTFEYPLDIPNRAQVVKVQASYRDAPGANTTPGATSGLGFSVVEYDQLGGNAAQKLALPAGANPALGLRSRDGIGGTFALPLAGNGFRVDNSRKRYVLRVRFDAVTPNTKFFGFTIQYVIGRGLPGSPAN
jgi:hypothetical protein